MVYANRNISPTDGPCQWKSGKKTTKDRGEVVKVSDLFPKTTLKSKRAKRENNGYCPIDTDLDRMWFREQFIKWNKVWIWMVT